MLKWLVVLPLIVSLFMPMSEVCAIEPESDFANEKSLEMIRAMNDNRKIRASEALTKGDIERVYYIASDQETDVFCILNKQADGLLVRDVETSKILPADSVDTPQIAFDNDQRVYITYYPGEIQNTSVFSYGITLVIENTIWYVESVAFGSLHTDTQVFEATVVNLATKNTSTYSFDTKTEEIISSIEKTNNLHKIKVSDFSLENFEKSIGLNNK